MNYNEEIKTLETRLANERERESKLKEEIEAYRQGNKDYSHIIPRLEHIEDRIEIIEYRIGQLKTTLTP